MSEPEELHRLSVQEALAYLGLFGALAIFHTWPLASGLESFSRHDNADAALNEWILAWVAHQLVVNPAHLFDANIFFPEPNTLAFSEHLFLQSLLASPMLWSGVSTLAAHNVLLIAGFALTGWTMALVVYRWTGDRWAAVLAGMLLAFNAHTLTHLAHLQAIHVQFLPLAVFFLDRLLTRPRLLTAIWLALTFVGQSLASNYLLVFITFGLLAAAVSRPREWLSPGRMRTLGLLGLSAMIAVLCLLPFLLPYLAAQRQQGLTRELAEVTLYGASWRDYFAASSRLHHGWWSQSFSRGLAYLFPGVTALLLAVAAIFVAPRRRAVARMWLGLGLAGLVLSFGTSVPGYELLYRTVPLLQGIRASVRFGYLALAAIAALAALGLAAIRLRADHRPRLRMALSIAALALVTIEAARMPLGFTAPHRPPPGYEILADDPDAVLVEFPLYSPRRIFLNSSYMLNSTRHWRPIVNGYSGFTPQSYITHWETLRRFPDPESLQYLRRLGVTHVVVHAKDFLGIAGPERLRRVGETPGLTLLQGGSVAFYRLSPSEQ